MKPFLFAVAALCAPIAIAQPSLHADDFAGLGVAYGPRHAGAAARAARAIPLMEIERSVWLLRTTQGVPEAGVMWSPWSGLKLGLVATFEEGRAAQDVPAFSGHAVPDDDAGGALGPIAEASLAAGPVPVRLTARMRRALERERGTQIDVRIAFGVLDVETLKLNAFARATWGDAAARTWMFGVPRSTAASTGLPPVNFGAGLQDTGLGLAARWDSGRRWSVVGSVERRHLAGMLLDGPIARTPVSTSIAAGLVWRLP